MYRDNEIANNELCETLKKENIKLINENSVLKRNIKKNSKRKKFKLSDNLKHTILGIVGILAALVFFRVPCD